jgi:hypothetical protein
VTALLATSTHHSPQLPSRLPSTHTPWSGRGSWRPGGARHCTNDLDASLGANVATAGFLDLAHPPAWLRFGIAGWPALAFLGGTLLAHSPAATHSESALDAYIDGNTVQPLRRRRSRYGRAA